MIRKILIRVYFKIHFKLTNFASSDIEAFMRRCSLKIDSNKDRDDSLFWRRKKHRFCCPNV